LSVTAVIPAYNEEKYISDVIQPLIKVKEINQIVVVSDGSTDDTVQEAQKYGVQVIELKENIGKGGALTEGIKHTVNNNVLFLDADLIGLNEEHILNLINPVINNNADMTVGIFENGRLATDMAQCISPYLSGQRCIKKQWLDQMNLAEAGFGAEAVLNGFAHQHNLRLVNVYLANMSHVMKEEKLGLVRGFAYRMKMYWEIAKNVRIRG
jgi:glycosyltransferase involved in cell wall biosynthesis